MPHCVIEYAKPLKHIISVEALVEATHQALIDTGLFEPQAIKTRAHGVEHFRIGEDEANTFVHIHMAIMPGRTDEQKALLLERVFESISLITNVVSSVTMEIVDINKQHYLKVIN
ncbi:5-carboxymethyl-2-hydroxymuconate isomerase [Shewanella sp. Choline-02u-19]|uniref:5-carboxymethyl-2-hydroxymuconate Delta-isomerase n=1 Tax=unclassified Shewanella TaxID=196818 RepID=UPI000C325887|nr:MULTISPECIES: 5-carboxymethyl-2-hydroxymuconate Delta-isomerase [unclassified Shewanella]PKG58409.1 5-carboxymethyl-2-hydroxymuconate isomerase [Shewanella sp. GutDb-MelDb]PKG73319.1 5-carboxymethyl-2-hydroxymuconate isomerase [Shewanella sp. GutCb]PKH59213.1 5-carboxymethyl-2-hydroxymuconate isomerase [Shewanella sp. Bg11-22]PKI27088.1 5-carboxymethyl-2-hydroxymuconate isomerase [Shewanella sp. Choline-02u-19]